MNTTSRSADPQGIARRLDNALMEAWNRHALEEVVELFTPDAVLQIPTIPTGPVTGHEAILAELRAQIRAFPDFALTRNDRWVAEDGRTVAVCWTLNVTFAGPLEPAGFAPTDQPLSVPGMTRLEISDDGRICDMRAHFDLNEIARAIGALPPPGSAAERMAVRLQHLKAWRVRRRNRGSMGGEREPQRAGQAR